MGIAAAAKKLGICQWFDFQNYGLVEAAITRLKDLNVKFLRTGISWADYHRQGGKDWYDWKLKKFSDAGLDLLISIWHTPPSISEDPNTNRDNIPPKNLKDYADFIDLVMDNYGKYFEYLEIWNEPNNPFKWDRKYDPDYSKFTLMAYMAGNWIKQKGKKSVLGGMCHLDPNFINIMKEKKVIDMVDIFGIHIFPRMWEPWATDWEHPSHWFGWEHRIRVAYDSGKPVWITETGLATYFKKNKHPCCWDEQAHALLEASNSSAERVYWYSLFDLDPNKIAIEEANGAEREEAEYNMGLIKFHKNLEIMALSKELEKPAYKVAKKILRDQFI